MFQEQQHRIRNFSGRYRPVQPDQPSQQFDAEQAQHRFQGKAELGLGRREVGLRQQLVHLQQGQQERPAETPVQDSKVHLQAELPVNRADRGRERRHHVQGSSRF